MTRSSRHDCDERTGIKQKDDHWKAFNDTKYQRHHGKADVYETKDARHCRTKSAQASVVPQQGSPKGCFLSCKKKNGGLNTTKVPETFCQRLNNVAESCLSLSLASKIANILQPAMCRWDKCNTKLSSRG